MTTATLPALNRWAITCVTENRDGKFDGNGNLLVDVNLRRGYTLRMSLRLAPAELAGLTDEALNAAWKKAM